MLFDSHAHYCDSRFQSDLEKTLEAAFESGVGYILTCPSTPEDTLFSQKLSERYPQIYFAAGVHPHECSKYNLEETLAFLKETASHEKCVAIGETGLDYHYDFSPRELQKKWFEAQCALALEVDKPVVIHNREAYADTFSILKTLRPRGVLHSYSGSAESVRELEALGLYISFSGMITFPNTPKLSAAAAAVSAGRLMAETDCPYLAPVPMRGKRNFSGYLCYTVARLAELRGITPKEAEALTAENAMRLFGIT